MTGRGSSTPDWAPPEPNCDQLLGQIHTLADVDLAVAEGLVVGEVLVVGLSDQRYPIVTRDGQRLGNIVTNPLVAIVRCIRDEGPFSATVVEYEGSWVRVRLQRS